MPAGQSNKLSKIFFKILLLMQLSWQSIPLCGRSGQPVQSDKLNKMFFRISLLM
jgi:hypothetical protein